MLTLSRRLKSESFLNEEVGRFDFESSVSERSTVEIWKTGRVVDHLLMLMLMLLILFLLLFHHFDVTRTSPLSN
tara:strand:+ start:68 stop:289 length:222 start_codon:yes stop_codon:yes gene_type:complete